MDIEKDANAIKTFFLKYDRILIRSLLGEIGRLTNNFSEDDKKKVVENISDVFVSAQSELRVFNAKVYEMALANIIDDTEDALERYGTDDSETNWNEYNKDIAKLIWNK